MWALHLASVYLAQHIACATADSHSAETLVARVIIGATAVVLLLLVIPVAQPPFFHRFVVGSALKNENGRFILSITRWMALLAIFGVFWQGSAVFLWQSAPRCVEGTLVPAPQKPGLCGRKN